MIDAWDFSRSFDELETKELKADRSYRSSRKIVNAWGDVTDREDRSGEERHH